MTKSKVAVNPKEMSCANCGFRRFAEANPDKLLARLWKWHTGWCPGWNAYQNALAKAQEQMVQATTVT